MQRIKIKKELCMSCLNCSLACMMEHNKQGTTIYDLNLEDVTNESRNHIALDQNLKPVPIFCRHCDEPECVLTCMSGAMTKDKQTGLVLYSPDRCASCFMCVMSCPYGVLKPEDRTNRFVLKCDMCNGRKTPRCIENCPTNAIYLEEGTKK